MFKKGDTVRYRNCDSEYTVVGTKGSVVSIANSRRVYRTLAKKLVKVGEAKVSEHMFEKGDKFRVVKITMCQHKAYIGEVLTSKYTSECGTVVDMEYGYVWMLSEVEKIGETMSKYEELKQRINGLNNGWDKDADDIVQEIIANIDAYTVYFKCWQNPSPMDGGMEFRLGKSGCYDDKTKSRTYENQCGKLKVYKTLLLWLLDQSSIKHQIIGQEVKADIEGKIYKVKVLEVIE